MITLVFSLIYVLIMLCLSPTGGERNKSDYALMLLQCILGIAFMILPGLLEHKVRLVIPSKMFIMYALFLYGAIYLGEVRDFYYAVPHWDTILHTLSGGMLGAFSYSIIVFLNKTDRVPLSLTPAFVAVFTLCFSITLGVVWEIYEFASDAILGLNMQKAILRDGTPLVGKAALSDTMKDLIVDSIGALVISVIGYVSLKYKKGWVEKLILKIKK